jgi:hypothetical protein
MFKASCSVQSYVAIKLKIKAFSMGAIVLLNLPFAVLYSDLAIVLLINTINLELQHVCFRKQNFNEL